MARKSASARTCDLQPASVTMLPPHHADPFDRMLVAQSIAEPLRLLTHDRLLPQYGDSVQYV